MKVPPGEKWVLSQWPALSPLLCFRMWRRSRCQVGFLKNVLLLYPVIALVMVTFLCKTLLLCIQAGPTIINLLDSCGSEALELHDPPRIMWPCPRGPGLQLLLVDLPWAEAEQPVGTGVSSCYRTRPHAPGWAALLFLGSVSNSHGWRRRGTLAVSF